MWGLMVKSNLQCIAISALVIPMRIRKLENQRKCVVVPNVAGPVRYIFVNRFYLWGMFTIVDVVNQGVIHSLKHI